MSMPTTVPPSMPPGRPVSRPSPCAVGSAPNKSSSTGRCRSRPDPGGWWGRLARGIAGEGGPVRACGKIGTAPPFRFAVKIEHQVERVEKRCHQIEQRPKANAAGDQVVFADGELGQTLKSGGIAG